MLYKKMTVSIEYVTPEIAKEWMKHNIHKNRELRKDRVESYEYDLLFGHWSMNGESIKFDCEGNMIDGQHRLQACINTGIGFTTVVVRGVDDNAFRTVDVGMVRTSRQLLKMDRDDGIGEKKNAVGITNIFIKSLTSIDKPTESMRKEFINANVDLLQWYYDLFKNSGNKPSIYAAVAIAAHINGEEDDEITGFIEGATRNDFDPNKNVKTYKLCVNAEQWRTSIGHKLHYRTNLSVMKRYLYSYINNMNKLTNKENIYPCYLGDNLRLKAGVDKKDRTQRKVQGELT